MATQYTSILKLALPVTGELSGTWGDVVNNNITSMVEQAIAGLSTINTWTANAHTLTVADGTTSESRCAMLVAATGAGGTALTAAGEIICPAASKLYVLKNGAAYAVTLKTAAGTGVAVPAGDTAFLFCDGTNVNACVTTIVNGHISGNLTVDGNTTLGDANTDTVTVTAQFASDLLPSTDNARDLGSTAKSWRTLYCDTSVLVGNLSLAGNTLSSTDTNGNIVIAPNGTGDVQLDADTVRVGDSNANATITTNGTGDLILNTNAGTNSGSITIEDGVNGNIIIAPNGTGQVQITNAALDLTTIEVSNINAKDGTAAITIADSTGAVGISTAVTMSATTQNIALGTSQTTGTFTVGGAAQTGTQTFDQSTKTHTLNVGTGATESGLTKTINLGTGGVATSTTAINIGSANGTTLTINSSAVSTPNGLNFDSNTFVIDATNNRVGINNASPTVALDVTGALTISGNAILGDATTDTVTVNGYMGVGGAGTASFGVSVSSSALTNTSQRAFRAGITATSAATTSVIGYSSSLSTAAAAFTVADMAGFYAFDNVVGAGSTITNNHGLYIANQTAGTNNYGITSLVSSGANKWNIYASGTANNYLRGNLYIGQDTTANGLQITYSSPESKIYSAVGTGSRLVFATSTSGGVEAERLRLSSTEAVFNDPGNDYDFRVESDTNTHALFVQGSDGFVGIGTSTPVSVFDVAGITPVLTIKDTQSKTWVANDTVGDLDFYSTDPSGTGPRTVARIRSFADANGTTAAGALSFWTSAADSAATEKMRLTREGYVLVGTTASLGTAGVQVAAVSTDPFEGYRFGANANGPTVSLYKNRGATVGTNAVVVSGDELGTIAFRGYDGAAYRAGAFITGNVDGTPGASDMPGRLTFSTTADGAATPTERMRIDSSGALIAKPAAGTGAVFNEDGVDADFRVESDTNTHALFVDAGNSRVGVNESAPDHALSVNGIIQATNNAATTIAAGATTTVITPPRGFSYINISRSDTAAYGLLLLVFRTSTTLEIVSTVSDKSVDYSASVSGTSLQVTNSSVSSKAFYASCVCIAFGAGD